MYIFVLSFAKNRTGKEEAYVWVGKAVMCLLFIDMTAISGTVFIPAYLIYATFSIAFLYCLYRVWSLRNMFGCKNT
jgi:hypothetical protein